MSLVIIRDAIELYAELSIALAGFAGVDSAFAGRERAFRPIERMRLEGIVILSAAVLGGCLAYLSAGIAGLSERNAESVSGLVALVLPSPVLRLMPNLWRRARDAEATVFPWSLYMVTCAAAIEIALLSSVTPELAEEGMASPGGPHLLTA